ncbi:SGNH/GDSL hydrolase family protein [Winogradskyella sp.]|uniref:SGNH/GDSL hydrolase family protein n=1 Tax=Winogradskyella sp. TaxID=1883156 RepID=UPI0038698CB1
MKNYLQIVLFGCFMLLTCCTSDRMLTAEDVTEDFEEEEEEEVIPNAYKILSLGDSYTIGQSVCETCRFPEQLKDSLISIFPIEDTFSLSVIAQTGWTTTSLKNAIINENPANDHDLVTLLIGVNNQFQGRPFSLYEAEFPELVTTAITLAKNDKNNVIVVSIPDYAFTPFGQGTGNPTNTSLEIDQYNVFAESYCDAQNITFVNITDITRQGLTNTALVASDGLHPSELAYTRFVQRLLPIAVEKIE